MYLIEACCPFRKKLQNCLPSPVDRWCYNVIEFPEAPYERRWGVSRETCNAVLWTPLSPLDCSTGNLLLCILLGQAEVWVTGMHHDGGFW